MEMSKCTVCGREIPIESNFCNFCGNKVIKEQSVNSTRNVLKEITKETSAGPSLQTAVGAIIAVCILCTLFAIVSPFFSKYLDKAKEVINIEYDEVTTGAVDNAVEYIVISSTDLIACFKENQVNCKNLYDNKNLEVSGTVEDIGTDIRGDVYVCLGSDTDHTFVGIQCYAKDKATEDIIATLKKGDVITVRGKGDCGSLSFEIEKAEIAQ